MDVASFSNWRPSLARLNLTMDACKNGIRVVPVGTVWSRARITGSITVVMFPRFVGMIFTHGAKPADTSRIGRYSLWCIRPVFSGKGGLPSDSPVQTPQQFANVQIRSGA